MRSRRARNNEKFVFELSFFRHSKHSIKVSSARLCALNSRQKSTIEASVQQGKKLEWKEKWREKNWILIESPFQLASKVKHLCKLCCYSLQLPPRKNINESRDCNCILLFHSFFSFIFFISFFMRLWFCTVSLLSTGRTIIEHNNNR